VIALAGSPLVDPVPEPVRKRAIWEMPLFHWGAVAATVAVVAVAVSLGTHQRSKSPTAAILNETLPPQMATEKVAASPSAKLDQEAASATPSAKPNQETVNSKPAPSTPARRAVHLQEQVRYERIEPEPQANAASPTGGPVMAGITTTAPATAKVLAPQKLAAPPPPAGVATDSRDRFAATVVPDQAQKTSSPDMKQAPAAAPPANGIDLYASDKAASVSPKEATTSRSLAALPQAAEAQNAFAKSKKDELARPHLMAPAAPFHEVRPIISTVTGTQWQITNEGQLQRLYMGQSGWQNMLSDHTFRSVAVVRDHIWAGGDNGLLYFSSDNGRSWQPLKVQSGNVSLTGNIVHMRFDDDTHGTIETSAGESWNTSDGGKTWIKQ
ncbi:MAG TPA: hypothetical protein VG897_07730, partial [Terriglobales bacterium]|nr:hypothetical protein [Terriglobales bacterium]